MAKSKAELAKEALERAKKHLARAAANPKDADQVFLWSFYALENAIVAAAIHGDVSFEKNHGSKMAASRRLDQKYGLTRMSDLLADLNQARKGTTYGDEDEPDLEPDGVLQDVKDFLWEVESFLQPKKKK